MTALNGCLYTVDDPSLWQAQLRKLGRDVAHVMECFGCAVCVFGASGHWVECLIGLAQLCHPGQPQVADYIMRSDKYGRNW